MILTADTPVRIQRGLYFYSTRGGDISATISLFGRSYEALIELTSVSDTNGYIYLPECDFQFTGTGDFVLAAIASDKR